MSVLNACTVGRWHYQAFRFIIITILTVESFQWIHVSFQRKDQRINGYEIVGKSQPKQNQLLKVN